MQNNFAAFILSHGRPDNVQTYKTLRRHGYTGRIVIVIDDLDGCVEEYRQRYGEEVYVFDKKKVAASTDRGDNFESLCTVLFARNACFEIAKDLDIRYFIQLDDDYKHFHYRYDSQYKYWAVNIHSLDAVFKAMVGFLNDSKADTVCMTQGGDFIGGSEGRCAKKVMLLRKAMNSFICDASRPIQFLGRLNDDMNTVVSKGSLGHLMFSTTQVSLVQPRTQSKKGGMSEAYLDAGTYVKSFYTVMMQPSSVKVSMMHSHHTRIHHEVTWRNTVPMIVRESIRKEGAA